MNYEAEISIYQKSEHGVLKILEGLVDGKIYVKGYLELGPGIISRIGKYGNQMDKHSSFMFELTFRNGTTLVVPRERMVAKEELSQAELIFFSD